MQSTNILLNNKTNLTCIICYKQLSITNNCTAKCGHRFCLSCLFSRASIRKKCPFCNQSLIESNTNNIQVEEEHPLNNNYEEAVENTKKGSVDDIAKRLIDKGVTMVDVLSYFTKRYNSHAPPFRHHSHNCHIYYKEYMEQTIEEVFEEVDNIAEL